MCNKIFNNFKTKKGKIRKIIEIIVEIIEKIVN